MKHFLPALMWFCYAIIAGLIISLFVNLILADNTDYRTKEITSLKHQLTESQHLLELSEQRYQSLCDLAPQECLKVE